MVGGGVDGSRNSEEDAFDELQVAGQSTDQHLPASGPRALQDTQHEDAASLLVTGVEVLALSITGLYICGHDGVSTHPYDTTQHYIAPHHTTPHLSTPHYTTPDHTTPTHTQVADTVYILIAENGFDKQTCAAYVDYLQRSTHAWQKQRLVEQPQTVRCRRAASTRIDCTGSLRNVCNARGSIPVPYLHARPCTPLRDPPDWNLIRNISAFSASNHVLTHPSPTQALSHTNTLFRQPTAPTTTQSP